MSRHGKEDLAMSSGASRMSEKSRRVFNGVEFTPRDDDPVGDGSDDESDESDSDDDGGVAIKLEENSEASAGFFHNDHARGRTQPQPDDYLPQGLPSGISWPEIMIKHKSTHKFEISRQFVRPQIFALRLDAENPDINFTIPQYEAAYAEAVNQCRGKVDLTATFNKFSGLDEYGFESMINDQFNLAVERIESAKWKTQAQKVKWFQDRIRAKERQVPVDQDRLEKLRRRLSMLTEAEDLSTTRKAEKLEPGGRTRRTVKIEDNWPEKEHRGSIFRLDSKRQRTGVNDVSLTHNRATGTDIRPIASFSASTSEARYGGAFPTFDPVSLPVWHSNSRSTSSLDRNLDTGHESSSHKTAFTPYVPLSFLGNHNVGSRNPQIMVRKHPKEDLHRPKADPDNPSGDVWGQQAQNDRPRPVIYGPAHNMPLGPESIEPNPPTDPTLKLMRRRELPSSGSSRSSAEDGMGGVSIMEVKKEKMEPER